MDLLFFFYFFYFRKKLNYCIIKTIHFLFFFNNFFYYLLDINLVQQYKKKNYVQFINFRKKKNSNHFDIYF